MQLESVGLFDMEGLDNGGYETDGSLDGEGEIEGP